MAEIFDPNATQDFDAETAVVSRQQKLADFLRKQYGALQGQVPSQGQMVGGQWIAPSAGQAVVAAAGGYEANKADQLAAQQEQAMLGRQAQQAAQWRASLPQATAAVKGMPANYVMESPEGQAGTPDIPAVSVDAPTRLKHTLEGMRNPMTAKEAVTWNTGMAEETKREDTQQAARENLTATLQQRMFDAKLRSQDANATLAQKAEYQKEYLRLQDEWRRLASDDKRYMADALGGRAATDRADKAQERKDIRIEKQVEHLAAAAKTLAPMLQSAQTVQNMLDDYGKKPIPGIGYEAKLPGILLPAEGVNNKAKIKAFANAMLRAQAGLSQTLSETENANLELLANGNYSEKEFRQIWPTLMDKINASATTTTSGFEPEAVETVRKRGGVIDPIKPRAAKTAPAKPAAAPTVAPTGAGVNGYPASGASSARLQALQTMAEAKLQEKDPYAMKDLDKEIARLNSMTDAQFEAEATAGAGGPRGKYAYKSALPAAKAATKPNVGWKIEAVP